MKFKYGDLVYHKMSTGPQYGGITALQVMEYDHKKRKYKCVSFDTYIIYDDAISFAYVKEDELEFINKITDEREFYINGQVPFPKNMDDTYFDIYDWEKNESKLIRKSLRQRKDIHKIPISNQINKL